MRLGRLELRLGVDRLLELRLELAEPLLGVEELVLRAAEVRADQLEVLLEAPEVLLQLRAVGHHLVRVLLDLEPLQPEHDHLQVRGQRGRRDGQHALLVRVREQRAGAAAGELVVDRLRRAGT